MLKLILKLSLCLAVVSVAYAGVYSERYFKDSAHAGKCVIQNRLLSPGESIKHPKMECAQFTCDNAQGLATIETCDPVHALASPLTQLKGYDAQNPPRCTWGDFVNTKAPYPDCCQRHYSCVF